MFWLFCRTLDSFYRWWGIAQPMDAPTEVTRWDGRTYRGISIALSITFVIWRGQAPLNIWTCSSSEKYAFGGMFPCTICLSSLLSLLIMTQTPHFHVLSNGNRWAAGSTVITAIAWSWTFPPHRNLCLSPMHISTFNLFSQNPCGSKVLTYSCVWILAIFFLFNLTTLHWFY